MGGSVPLGYEVKDRKLIIKESEAAIVRMIFERFVAVGSATALARALVTEGVRSRRGRLVDKGFLYKLLANRVYIGDAVHKGTAYPGEHKPIVSRELFDRVRATLQVSPRMRASSTRASAPALLRGLLFGPTGCAMSPSHSRKGDKLYRYYVSQSVIKRGAEGCPVSRVPAAEIENAVVNQLRGMLRAPEVIIATWLSARPELGDLSEDGVREVLAGLDPLWDELFPAEQTRVIQLLVERIDVGLAGLKMRLRVQGVARMVQDLAGITAANRRAA
jgi:hypothetical protein